MARIVAQCAASRSPRRWTCPPAGWTGEAPSRVVLDVPFRVIAKILLSVLVFSIAVSLLDSVRTV